MRRFLMLSILTLPLIAPAQVVDSKLRIYQHWNDCVDSLKAEGDFDSGLWPRLLQSLKDDPPEHVKSLDRIAMYDELIAEHEKRIAALKKMKELEKK